MNYYPEVRPNLTGGSFGGKWPLGTPPVFIDRDLRLWRDQSGVCGF